MSDTKDSRPPPPSNDITFDGNPMDLDRVFAHCVIQHLLHPAAFVETKVMVSYLLAHFRGPALDWAAKQLASNSVDWNQSYDQFCTRVKAAFAYTDNQTTIIARTRLVALKQRGGLREFLIDFENLSFASGMTADTVRSMLIFDKLKPYYQNAWTQESTLINPTWSALKLYLLNVAARHEEHGVTEEAARKKSKCGKCGKAGHTSTQCRASN